MNVFIAALAQGLLWSVMAIGVYITFRILEIADLTAEGCFTLGASVVAHFVITQIFTKGATYHFLASTLGNVAADQVAMVVSNPIFASLMAILAGMLAGMVTGILHTQLKIPALLSGILVMTGLYSVNLRIMGKANVALLDDNLQSISILNPLVKSLGISPMIAAVILGTIVCCAVILLLWLFFNTEIGYMLRATGNNPNMVRALGVNTDTMIILGLVIGNGLVGLGSALVGQYNGFSDISMGTGTIVIGLSSVIIGEVLFGNLLSILLRKRSLLIDFVSVVLGSILYRWIIATVLKWGLNTNDLKLFSSIILTIALATPLLWKKMGGAFLAKNLKRG